MRTEARTYHIAHPYLGWEGTVTMLNGELHEADVRSSLDWPQAHDGDVVTEERLWQAVCDAEEDGSLAEMIAEQEATNAI